MARKDGIAKMLTEGTNKKMNVADVLSKAFNTQTQSRKNSFNVGHYDKPESEPSKKKIENLPSTNLEGALDHNEKKAPPNEPNNSLEIKTSCSVKANDSVDVTNHLDRTNNISGGTNNNADRTNKKEGAENNIPDETNKGSSTTSTDSVDHSSEDIIKTTTKRFSRKKKIHQYSNLLSESKKLVETIYRTAIKQKKEYAIFASKEDFCVASGVSANSIRKLCLRLRDNNVIAEMILENGGSRYKNRAWQLQLNDKIIQEMSMYFSILARVKEDQRN